MHCILWKCEILAWGSDPQLSIPNAVRDHCPLPTDGRPCSLTRPRKSPSFGPYKEMLICRTASKLSARSEMLNIFVKILILSTPSWNICSRVAFPMDALSSRDYSSCKNSSTWQLAAFAFCWAEDFGGCALLRDALIHLSNDLAAFCSFRGCTWSGCIITGQFLVPGQYSHKLNLSCSLCKCGHQCYVMLQLLRPFSLSLV